MKRHKKIVIYVICVITVLFAMCLLEITSATGESMQPTLLYGDNIVYLRILKYLTNVHRQDIVELTPPTGLNNPLLSGRYRKIIFGVYWDKEKRKIGVYKFALIKRVIGIPGDLIEIKEKQVYINNEPLLEQYVQYTGTRQQELQWSWDDGTQCSQHNLSPIKIPEGCYFVMGDNRDNSGDSRAFGFIKKDNIKAKALFILYSYNEADGFSFNRILKSLK